MVGDGTSPAFVVSPRPTSLLVSPLAFGISPRTGTAAGRLRRSVHCRLVAGPGGTQVVLVVDDEPAIRLLCRVNLELDGYEVREAATLGEARTELAGGVDVVLLDMHIGVERGYALLDEIIAAGIPVAIVTGSTELEAIAGTGADAVLGKPFTIEDLVATVARLAGR